MKKDREKIKDEDSGMISAEWQSLQTHSMMPSFLEALWTSKNQIHFLL